MYRLFLLFLGFLVLAVSACRPDPPTPEDIVAKYVEALASYEFDKAARMSTPRQAAYLDALATVIGDDPPTPDSAWVVIEAIACESFEDTVLCLTLERDPYESTEKEYLLVKNGETWLIDQPADEGQLEYGEE